MAARFWVGGSGTWDTLSTANWSATSGGASGALAPTILDAVTFDANSGSGTCTTAAGSTCSTLTFNSATVGLTLGANHTMSGQFTLTSGNLSLQSFTLTCGKFNSQNSNVRSINFGNGNITITGNNSTIFTTSTPTNLTVTGTALVNATYSGAIGTRTITPGLINTSTTQISVNVSAGSDIVTSAGTPAFNNLNFTGFSGTLNNTARTIRGNLTISSGMTLAAGSLVTTFSETSGTQAITTNNKTIDFPLTFNGVGGTFAFQDALTQGSTRAFTITNGTVQLKAGVTSTVGSLTTSTTNQKFLQSTLASSQATLSQASGTVSVGYLTIKDINASGGATFNAFTVNSNVNAGNNLGWDFFAQLGKTIFTRRKEKRVLI